MAWAGICIQSSERRVFYKIGCFQERGTYGGSSFRVKYSAGRLQRHPAHLSIHKNRIARVKFILQRRIFAISQRHKGRNRGSVRQFSVSVLKSVMNSPQSPHSFVKMRIQMTMKNYIADNSIAASGSIEDIQCITLLRAYGNGINYSGYRIFRLQSPLVIMEMEYMGLFDSAVNQTYLRRVTHICPKDRRSSEADMPADSAITIDERRLLRTPQQQIKISEIRRHPIQIPEFRTL